MGWALPLFIVLSVLGIANAAYLVKQHYKKKPLICPLDHDCSVVTESRWSHIFFIRNEILGLSFFLVLLGGILLSIFAPSLKTTIIFLLPFVTGLGLLFSVFLLLVQIYAIKDYCFYCLISALLTLLLFMVSFFI